MAHPECATIPRVMPFKPGQGRAPKLTPEVHELFINTVKQTGRWTAAAMRCAVGIATVHTWFAKGRTQRPGQPYRDFLDAAMRARADFVTVAAARHHQLAVGGVIKLPAMDKDGNPVRAHEPDCKTPSSCRCEIVFVDKVVMPSERALEFELDRLDPIGQTEEQMPELPTQTKAELEAEGARYLDLFAGGIKILVDLGVPLPQIAPPAVDTTATKVEETPAEGGEVVGYPIRGAVRKS